MIGTFGQIGYLSGWLHPNLPTWLVIPIFILPIALVIFVQPKEVSDVLVKRVHTFAALWYLSITLTSELYSVFGNTLQGETFFRVLMHVGWLQFAVLFKQSNKL